jgi:hypothetical protein
VNFVKKKLQVLARSKEFIVIFHDTNHYLESYCNQCSTFYECFRILKKGWLKIMFLMPTISQCNHRLYITCPNKWISMWARFNFPFESLLQTHLYTFNVSYTFSLSETTFDVTIVWIWRFYIFKMNALLEFCIFLHRAFHYVLCCRNPK